MSALTTPLVFSSIRQVRRPALPLLPSTPSKSAFPTACLLRFRGRRCRQVPAPALAAASPLARYGLSLHHARTLAPNQIPGELRFLLQPDGSLHRRKVDLTFAGAKGNASEELVRGQQQGPGSVRPDLFYRYLHCSVVEYRQALLGQGAAKAVAQGPFELTAVVAMDALLGVQVEPM